MKKARTQADLARKIGLKSRWPITAYLKGQRNASLDVADKLAEETNTSHRLWMKGGPLPKRCAAVAAWIAREPLARGE